MEATKIFLNVAITCLSFCAFGQVRQSEGKLNVNTAPGGIVEEISLPKSETQGTYFLFEDWDEALIVVGLTQYRNQIRYDIKNNQFEIKYGKVVRVLDGHSVSSFEVFIDGDSVLFLNASNHDLLKSELTGFASVLYESNNTVLYKHVSLLHLRPSYNVALDVGERSHKIVKSHKYYLQYKSQLYKVEKSKKKWLKQFPGQTREQLKKFIKTNDLSIKEETHLIEITVFLSELRM